MKRSTKDPKAAPSTSSPPAPLVSVANPPLRPPPETKPDAAAAAHDLVEKSAAATDELFREANEGLRKSEEKRSSKARELAGKTPEQQVEELSMPGSTARIVTHIFEPKEWHDDYVELRRALRFRDGRVGELGRGEILEALNMAEENAHRAAELLANMKHQHDTFEYTAGIVRGSMRDQATANLQAAKEAGKRSKAITNDDVEAEMRTLFPDAFAELEFRSSQVKRMIPVIEDLHERLVERARDLRQMLRDRD